MWVEGELTLIQNYYSIKVLFSSYDDFICQWSFNSKLVIMVFFLKQLVLPSVSPEASLCRLLCIIASCNVTQWKHK